MLQQIQKMVGVRPSGSRIDTENVSKGFKEQLMSTRVKYMAGVVDTTHMYHLKRLVLRATKCQAYVHSFEMNVVLGDQIIDDEYHRNKSIFVLAF